MSLQPGEVPGTELTLDDGISALREGTRALKLDWVNLVLHSSIAICGSASLGKSPEPHFHL